MKKNGKINIRRLINLEEKNGLQRSIDRINKRMNYLRKRYSERAKTRRPNISESNQIKYLKFHLTKLLTMKVEQKRKNVAKTGKAFKHPVKSFMMKVAKNEK